MALSLKLNLGGSTINLNDGTNYKVLDTWNPRVANYKVSQFGGLLYQEVVENIPLYIFGTTAALVYEKLEDIIVALNQARAWRLGAITDPVLLEFLPNNSSLGAVVQAACLGTPAEASDLYAAAQFGLYMAGNSFETLIDLPIVRRGVWLGAAETPAASASTANPALVSVTYASSLRIPAPVKLAFASNQGALFANVSGYIFTSDLANKILLLEAEDMTLGSQWASHVDADASGGDVVQRTPTSVISTSISKTGLTFNTGARLFAVFANLRNNSASVTYNLQVTLTSTGNNTSLSRVETVAVSQGETLMRLGIMALPNSLTAVSISATPSAGSGATHELEVDYIVIVAIDEFTKSIAFINSSVLNDPTIDHALLTQPNPIFSDNSWHTPYDGDLYIFGQGTNQTALIAGNHPALWGLRDISSIIMSYTLTATRHAAYLVVR